MLDVTWGLGSDTTASWWDEDFHLTESDLNKAEDLRDVNTVRRAEGYP